MQYIQASHCRFVVGGSFVRGLIESTISDDVTESDHLFSLEFSSCFELILTVSLTEVGKNINGTALGGDASPFKLWVDIIH